MLTDEQWGICTDAAMAACGDDGLAMYKALANEAYRLGVSAERKRCAGICAKMVIGGRAWTHDQQVAATVLLDAQQAIESGS